MTLPRSIAPNDVAALLKSEPAVVYLDVRSSREFEGGHPPRALNVPLAEFDPARGMIPNPRFMDVVSKLLPKDARIVVGCAAGGRSRQAQALLVAAGYSEVADMEGGFSGGPGPSGPQKGWLGCGLPPCRDGTNYAEALTRADAPKG